MTSASYSRDTPGPFRGRTNVGWPLGSLGAMDHYSHNRATRPKLCGSEPRCLSGANPSTLPPLIPHCGPYQERPLGPALLVAHSGQKQNRAESVSARRNLPSYALGGKLGATITPSQIAVYAEIFTLSIHFL